MVIYNLPNDFNSPEEQGKPVVFRSYQAATKSANNKSIINQNMVDILISGKKTIIDAHNITSFEAGELMILSKGSSLISQAVPHQGLFHNLVIYFTNEIFANFLVKYGALSSQHVKAVAKQPLVTCKQDAFIDNYINSVLLLLKMPLQFTDGLKQIKLEELLLYLLNSNPGKLESLSVIAKDNEDMQLRKVVESHITTPISIDELAFLCNTSPSTFKRRFFKMYGTSPQKWLTLQKMKTAASLLKQPNERPGIVYEKVGYENQSSFIMAFKNQYGVTPRDYQRKSLD